MTTLPQSLAIRSDFLKCGVTKSSGPKDSNRVALRNGNLNSFDDRKLLCGQIVPNNPMRNLHFEANATPRVSIESFQQIFSANKVEELAKEAAYLFRTEVSGLVHVLVGKKNLNCIVRIEVSSFELPSSDDKLVLNWGIFRGDSSRFLPLEFETSVRFAETSFGRFYAELEIDAKHIPCYISFHLRSVVNSGSSGLDIRSHRKTDFCVPLGFGSGRPTPLGLSFSHDGSLNFSVFSRNAEKVILCLYDDDAAVGDPVLELELDPYINRTGDLWHASFESSQTLVSYGYQFKGKHLKEQRGKLGDAYVILDPYSKILANSGPRRHGTRPKYLGIVQKEPIFDWSDDIRPNLPMEKLMVYRLNVKRFTEHKSSQLPPDIAGTFSGLTEKLEHLKYLGVNAVVLEPIFPFDEQKGTYFPHHFFSPMNLYGPSGSTISAINSMKEAIKKMHANGIEVLLEVVFTHTSETGALKGVDDLSYYLNGVKGLEGRTALNCNFPIVQQLILDSLRYWVTEFHVDGFCFINASSLLRGTDGQHLSRPPLVEAIAFDPILWKTKIIADFWDPHDSVPIETRFPHWKRWAELNSRFCSDVRNFIRGQGLLSSFATRLCGSDDIFSKGRGPGFSFNFVARQTGLPLVDLVSFSGDEVSSELSWNCGQEGPTNKTRVLERRIKQIRNFLFILYVSLGIPVLNMGDECGQSTGGSIAYSARKPYDWSTLQTGFGIQITEFIAFLSSLRRRRSDLLQKKSFWKEENIEWHGTNDQFPPGWEDPSSKFLAMRLRPEEEEEEEDEEEAEEEGKLGKQMASNDDTCCIEGDVFVAFNAGDQLESVVLPECAEGVVWCRLVDTALPFPGFFSTDGMPMIKVAEGQPTYQMKSFSCVLFEAKVE